MDEIIAHLHTATKSHYDRGQTVLQQANALATTAAAQTDAPTRAKINSTANAICLKARSVHVDALSLKKEVQGHETWYPTQATFEFRLWRLMDAVGYALAAEAAATAVLGDATMSDLLKKQSEDAHAEAMEHYRRAREHEAAMGKPTRRR